ncbi:MAG TPA: citryl-CoA lyase [Candidatus Sulfotelmatobacter sp.]|nr:citryl-CoA lyase [Candidatus Sulfotelmatobacter sp.]
MTEATAPYWKTSISDITAEDVFVRGFALKDLIGKLPFPAVVHLVIRGTMPTVGQAHVIDSILCSILDYGLQKSGTVAARYVVSVNPQMTAGLASAVLAAGEYSLSPEVAGVFIQDNFAAWKKSGKELGIFAKDLVDQLREDRKRIPGFGHPVFRNVDPRAQKLKSIAMDSEVWGDVGKFYEAVHAAFRATANQPGLVINDIGMIACILSEMGYSPQEMAGLAILSTIPGVIAHVSEELASNVRIRIVSDAAVEYDRSRHDLASTMQKAGWNSR